jgi:hypothetical protein
MTDDRAIFLLTSCHSHFAIASGLRNAQGRTNEVAKSGRNGDLVETVCCGSTCRFELPHTTESGNPITKYLLLFPNLVVDGNARNTNLVLISSKLVIPHELSPGCPSESGLVTTA